MNAEDTVMEQTIELKPVVPAKSLARMIRNIISNELGMTQEKFEELLLKRVDNYMTGNKFEELLERKVGTVLADNRWEQNVIKNKIVQEVSRQVQQKVALEALTIAAKVTVQGTQPLLPKATVENKGRAFLVMLGNDHIYAVASLGEAELIAQRINSALYGTSPQE